MKTVILTGSSSDLGKAIADKLLAEDYQVFALKIDLTDDLSCKEIISELKDKKVYALINIAGLTKYGESLNFTSSEFLDLLNLNVVGHFRLIKTLKDADLLPERVINITSLNSVLAWPKFALYCASKFAADGLGLALRYELWPKTQVSNLAPGAIYRPNTKIVHNGLRDKTLFAKWLFPYVTDEAVASSIFKLLKTKYMPARIMVGADAIIVYWMQKLLPLWLFDKIVLWLT